MKLTSTLTLLLALFATTTFAQKDLNYYLPDGKYDETIPTPEEFLGWQIGEWHISHDLQTAYLKMLAEASPRIQMKEYARSYEQRPLHYLTITSRRILKTSIKSKQIIKHFVIQAYLVLMI